MSIASFLIVMIFELISEISRKLLTNIIQIVCIIQYMLFNLHKCILYNSIVVYLNITLIQKLY